MTYYQRKPTYTPSGIPLLSNALDMSYEDEARQILGYLWNCEIKPFGRLSPVDFFALREGALVGVLELKSRTHASTTYPTVYLNLRKWGSLMLYHLGMGCPALFVVRFTDGFRWINITSVDATQMKIAGTRRIVKSHTDIEPIILVPVKAMETLAGAQEGIF